MNIRTFAFLIALLSVLVSRDLRACGDKFLVPSRGARFELSTSVRQRAMVLVYANPASALHEALSSLSVDPAVRKAGYRPTIVGSTEDLGQAIRRGGWDVVLVDVEDGPTIRTAAFPEDGPFVVAVGGNLSGTEMARAKKQYVVVLKSPSRGQAFVEAIDEAFARRRDAQSKGTKGVHR
jgi:hypothetical protein